MLADIFIDSKEERDDFEKAREVPDKKSWL